MRILANDFVDLFNCFQNRFMPDCYAKEDTLKPLKELSIQCMVGVFKDLYWNIKPEMFEYIYKNFKPNVHYTSSCFKIANTHYLEYIIHKFEKKNYLLSCE